MPIQLTAQGGDFRANVQALDAAQARQSLQKIQAHLSQPGKGTGTLTLFNRTKEGADLTLERKSGFQLLGRGARLKDTSDVLKTLLDRAGLPEARAELERHAGTRHRVGADKMLAILNRHLASGGREAAAEHRPGPGIAAERGARLPGPPSAETVASKSRPVCAPSLEGLLTKAGVERGAVLGAGQYGEVRKVKVAGEQLVLKTYHPDLAIKRGEPMILSNSRRRVGNEAIAAYLTSKANHQDYQVNVAQPRYFIVKPVSGDEHRMVNPLELRALLKETREVTWECVGLLMPEAKGGEVEELLAKGQLTQQNQRQIIKGTLEAVMKLNERGFIHRDLKPANMFFDAASGKTTLIDTGMMHKTSKNKPETRFLPGQSGTPLFKHPRMVAGGRCGSEADLCATALMAMMMEHPKTGSDLATEMHFRARDVGGNNPARILAEVMYTKNPLGQTVPRDEFRAIHDSLQDQKSLTSLALTCLEEAGKPATAWADRATAQSIYAQLLQHPTLQEA